MLDLFGRHMVEIVAGELDPGQYRFTWDGRADGGRPVAAGLYFVRLSGNGFRQQVARLALAR